MVVALVLVLVVADVVEDEELALGTEVGDVGEAGPLQERLRLARDVARVAGVVLSGERVADVADDHEGLCVRKGSTNAVRQPA